MLNDSSQSFFIVLGIIIKSNQQYKLFDIVNISLKSELSKNMIIYL